MAGLYIHIPFCKNRCAYCSFFSTVSLSSRERYADALLEEMRIRRGFTDGDTLKTIYFGGGTPSVLGAGLLGRVMDGIRDTLDTQAVTETTVECNPDDITAEFAESLAAIGANRASMGVQSFDDTLLKTVGRRHDSGQAKAAVRELQKAGFSNISIDLIYGLPGQTPEGFGKDLETAVSLGVQHISAYALSYEEGTRLWQMRARGEVKEASDDLSAEMFSMLCKRLEEAGFVHYEISNFALPGFHSRHNSSYWDGTRYLGIGAGAHSFDGSIRSWNISDLEGYMKGIGFGKPETGQEVLSPNDLINESVMLSLRTARGISLEQFESRFGADAKERLLRDAERWIKKGDLVLEGSTLRFSEPSLFISDDVISSLFLD